MRSFGFPKLRDTAGIIGIPEQRTETPVAGFGVPKIGYFFGATIRVIAFLGHFLVLHPFHEITKEHLLLLVLFFLFFFGGGRGGGGAILAYPI